MQSDQLIYFFGEGQAEGGEPLRHLVGGKGASLAEMTRAGLNVPPGFTISAACCEAYFRSGKQWPAGLEEAVRAALARLEQVTGRPFGRGGDPLLLAVRSGAARSMPGMMDTVLNVGLNPDCVAAVAQRTGNARSAWEAYRHFLALFARTVGGVPEATFTELIADGLRQAGKRAEAELDAEQLRALCQRLSDAYRTRTGRALPAEPWEALRAAIDAVFESWHSERAVTFRRHHRIEGLLGTAVNVQAMCPSEVAGVMFTADPVNPALPRIVIESSYGLGETVVLGKVTPDRFVLDKTDRSVRERHISTKEHVIAALARDGQGQAGARDAASLDDAQLAELAALGLRVEEYFKVPCDVEWGLSAGRFYLLQARPIKPGGSAGEEVSDAEREQVRREEITALAARADQGGTVWARYNLAEILPDPTPMTWAVVRRFMSGRGGFGLMYRDLGFDPDPALDEEGIFDLVCGRPYCNLSREPRLQYRRLPFEHPFAALKANPQKAVYPQAVLNPARGGWRLWLGLPVTFFKLWRQSVRLRKLARTVADRFRAEVVPAFVADVARAADENLGRLDAAALVARFEHWVQRTLYDFARDSLKPTALAGITYANLERALGRTLQPAGGEPLAGLERAQAALRELVMGVKSDAETDLPGAVRDLGAGKLERTSFLTRFGHRGSHEMELAQPRWSEDHAALDRLVQAGGGRAAGQAPDPDAALQRLVAETGLSAAQRDALTGELRTLRAYLGLRETAKHYLMRGYAEIRRTLLELDRRYGLEGGIFFLTPEELPRLAASATTSLDLVDLIGQRRWRRAAALSLFVPQVLFSDDLEAIGRPPPGSDTGMLQGVPLSAGVAEAPALVLEEPAGAQIPEQPYILVCPSTDPAWVPLFVHAHGLVMETGGVLSHGAIVAREFGLPAVAGLPEVYRRVRTGQRLRVDGGTGRVNILA
jgi:pyruvate,water dikinase